MSQAITIDDLRKQIIGMKNRIFRLEKFITLETSHYCTVAAGGAQTIASGAGNVAITFPTEIYDPHNMHSGTGGIVIDTAGLWDVYMDGALSITPSLNSTWTAFVTKNGTNTSDAPGTSTLMSTVGFIYRAIESMPMVLAVGDVIGMSGSQNGGATGTVTASTRLSAVYRGPA